MQSMKPPTLEDAIALATRAHAGQKDKAGADYITHPLRVMAAVNGEDARIVAVLHDVIEDTFVTPQYLREAGYAEPVIAAIESLTKLPDEEDSDAGYARFIRRAAQNPLARVVKIADLRDNMDLSRIAAPTAKDHARLAKYERALQALQTSF
jgi:(p)ppGpp synthase/HD superfamily hydrolase